ncbi:MAG: M28 family peptidase [Syntrophales bacterium]|nr:M28 family peptidase [Syntrophales bacterium]
MISYTLLVIIILVAFLIYGLVKIRLTTSISLPKPDSAKNEDVHRLYAHVEHISTHIGSRSILEYTKLEATKRYIVSCLESFGYVPTLQNYTYGGKVYSNVIVSMKGEKYPDETVIIGAHYDTVFDTPGADDNASAVAILLEMCRILKDYSPKKTLKLIFFVLEEPPLFRSEYMGSYIYAADAKARNENITAMLSLEMLGYYTDQKGGQMFPLPLMGLMYPSTPNFIGVVGNLKSKRLVERVKNYLLEGSSVPVVSLSTFSFVPGVDFSDHRSFWKMGYPAVMITDTAFYRNPNYHSERDTINTLNFDKMSDLLKGLVHVTKALTF